MRKDLDDRTEWRNERGYLHRLDGPAIERNNGMKEWWIYGERHRDNGPAIEFKNGTKCWYQNGKLHRLDGPAVEWFDKRKAWYINGEKYLEQEWFEALDEEDKISYLFNISG